MINQKSGDRFCVVDTACRSLLSREKLFVVSHLYFPHFLPLVTRSRTSQETTYSQLIPKKLLETVSKSPLVQLLTSTVKFKVAVVKHTPEPDRVKLPVRFTSSTTANFFSEIVKKCILHPTKHPQTSTTCRTTPRPPSSRTHSAIS